MQILDAFRSRQSEEHQRFNSQLSLQRGHALVIRKKWRQLKQFLTGPRGAWAHRCVFDYYSGFCLNFIEPFVRLFIYGKIAGFLRQVER